MSDDNLSMEQRVKELEERLFAINLRNLDLILSVERLIASNGLNKQISSGADAGQTILQRLDDLWLKTFEDIKNGP